MNVIWRTSRVLKIWFYDDLHLSVAIRYIVLFLIFYGKRPLGVRKKILRYYNSKPQEPFTLVSADLCTLL